MFQQVAKQSILKALSPFDDGIEVNFINRVFDISDSATAF